ncbi:hypothetical protein SBOR_7795 [Sclerotinia borealis F-4128]|uniref:Uncharacterized protein n=1 Tax=Sclerotinia borealis (strain F-4128) TaxID=1432307 RepID=W9C7L0_SCLBF|nr:hypothetical protein SBOR_7795 [Sclerotinia borealis F-4128]
MPFCPLNVLELPLSNPAPSPRVVDARKYCENKPEVFVSRKSMAPLDALVTCLWMLDPRYLQQFLNRRLPRFQFQLQRTTPILRRNIICMRHKMSESLHLIQLQSDSSMLISHGKWETVTTKVFYITDGHILRFECHDMNTNGLDANPSIANAIYTPALLQGLTPLGRTQLYITASFMQECKTSLVENGSRTYSMTWDGKWKKPDDLIICPRQLSRDGEPLAEYWRQEYPEAIGQSIKASLVFDVRLLPLWRRCVCQTPAVKFFLDRVERKNVMRKMKKFCTIQPYQNTVQYKDVEES